MSQSSRPICRLVKFDYSRYMWLDSGNIIQYRISCQRNRFPLTTSQNEWLRQGMEWGLCTWWRCSRRWTCHLQVAGSISSRSAFTWHRSTQPCIHPGSLNRVGLPALAGGKGGILTSVGWQVTLCDSIWHVGFP